MEQKEEIAAGGAGLRRNISTTLARQLVTALAQLALAVLIARALGPEGNGIYAMSILAPTLLVSIINLGVAPSTVYHLARGDLSAAAAFRGNLRLALVVAVFGFAVSAPVVGLWGASLFPGVPPSLLLLGLLSFPLALLTAYLSAILQGLEDFRAFNLTIVLPPCVTLLGSLIALLLLDAGAPGAIAAYCVGQLGGALVCVGLLARKVRGSELVEERVSLFEHARRIVGYGWKFSAGNVFALLNYRADLFLVNLLLTPVSTGLYVVAVQLAERLWMISQAVSLVLLPRLSAMHLDIEGRSRLAARGFWLVLACTGAAGIAAAVLLWWLLVPVFGKAYAGTLPAFLWLLPGIVASAGSRVHANAIAAAGKAEWNLYTSAGVFCLNLIGNLILIPDHGIVGAACATSIAYVINAVVKYWLHVRLSDGDRASR